MAEVAGAIGRVEAETTVSRMLHVTCTELVTLLDAQRAVVSRVIGDLIVELSDYDRAGTARPLELFLLSDYPLTDELIESGEPRVVLQSDPDADSAETALLNRLGHGSLLIVPLRSRGKNWGLVEIYGNGALFDQDEISVAVALVQGIGELLAELESVT